MDLGEVCHEGAS